MNYKTMDNIASNKRRKRTLDEGEDQLMITRKKMRDSGELIIEITVVQAGEEWQEKKEEINHTSRPKTLVDRLGTSRLPGNEKPN